MQNSPGAHFIGHSFGTIVLAWLCNKRPDLVKFATFLDPVCFLLQKPDISYNFVYRDPMVTKKPTHLLMNFFVAKELHIAHTLGRNFFWNQNLLHPGCLSEAGIPTLVLLSGQDSIVPAHSVRRFLIAHAKKNQNRNKFVVEWQPELGHGEWMTNPCAWGVVPDLLENIKDIER